MVMRVSSRILLIVAILVCACGRSPRVPGAETLAVQQAAIEFLARQSSATACVQIATGPGELVDGLVAKNLQDPPSELLRAIRSKGVIARPYSTCHEGVVIAVGWPAVGGKHATVPADWLCGPGCGNGYEVEVVKDASGWRGIGAKVTWMS